MKVTKLAIIKGATVAASLAMITATATNSSTCYYFFHQPKVPAKLKDMKKG